jgi:hypothetical protein
MQIHPCLHNSWIQILHKAELSIWSTTYCIYAYVRVYTAQSIHIDTHILGMQYH